MIDMEKRGRKALVEGSLVEVPKDIELDNTELLWGQPAGWKPFLRHGRYIVWSVSPAEVRLSDADWDRNGRVIHNSAKHGNIVRGRGVAVLLAGLRPRIGLALLPPAR